MIHQCNRKLKTFSCRHDLVCINIIILAEHTRDLSHISPSYSSLVSSATHDLHSTATVLSAARANLTKKIYAAEDLSIQEEVCITKYININNCKFESLIFVQRSKTITITTILLYGRMSCVSLLTRQESLASLLFAMSCKLPRYQITNCCSR